ncbi:hypothetical protein BDV18DRAFT_131019 [Aspergillus unguis]
MHTSALACLALALTANAFPFARQAANTTVQRRSTDYNVVNVGDLPEAPEPQPAPSATTTVFETVTAPGAAPQTVTVTVSPTPTASPSPSSALWATSALPSSSSIPVPSPAANAESAPSAYTAMDRLARAFGRSIDSHLWARSSNLTTREVIRDVKRAANETVASSQFAARGINATEAARFARALYNSTELGTAGIKARAWNGTTFKA